ncbi:helicase [Mycobacterium sp. 852002-51971_SCH5477799-a]|nr:helicase [Mycobacterium sp. 852002-51971_SCH5477799-a]
MDHDDNIKGKQFEHICKWFLTNDPVYKRELRRVWLWDEWTGRWGGDAGIDLVAEDHTGNMWAIQAKAYDPAYRVTKRDVNKFLAESGREVFTYRMLIATSNLIDRIGERTVQDQEKRVTFFRLNDLQAADVDWPGSPMELRPTRPRRPARPQKHQRSAITKVLKGFESADRGQLIMACGTGKTLTALFIHEQLETTRTLVLVPSLSLLKQTLNAWRANCITEFASLPVCSDDTVANADDDVALLHTSDLGVPVTTDPADIAAFLSKRRGPRVVFATYQSSPQIAKAFALGRIPEFDLVIADEAHRCAGPVSSDFATVLDPAEIKAKRRLFMTATPRYFTGRVLKAAEESDFEYASMDDPKKFGIVFYRLGFGEAIERDLLTDYQVAIIGVDDATYRKWAENGALVTRDGVEVTDAATLAGQIGLAKAMRKYDLHRVISFHSRVKRARDFAACLPDVLAWMPARHRPRGRLWAAHTSGEMPAGDRYVLLQRLRRLEDADRGLLANARCLAEGVDVPTLDGVAFIDPRRSEVDIVQAVGRAIRLSADKTVGTIVIPVFIGNSNDPEVVLDSSAFKPVWDVIKALRSHDDQLGEELDELRRQLGRRGQRPRLPGKIHLDLPTRVGVDFARAFDVRLVEQTTATWEFWFGLLEQFIERHGHSRVPQSCTIDGYRLGTWINNQRRLEAADKLSADRRKRLEELRGWTWSARDDWWEDGFDELVAYVNRHGNSRVPQSYRTANGFQLGTWVQTQRNQFAESSFDLGRRRRLEELPGWAWNTRDARWEEGFHQLKRYGARPPKTYVTPEGYPLGKWAARQRQWRAEGTLSADRVRRLQKLPGWTWDAIHDARWEAGYDHLRVYVQEYGDALISQSYKAPDGYRLGAWVGQQRLKYRKNTLETDRVHRLEKVSGWQWTVVDKWPEGFARLEAYVERNGDALVPKSYVDERGYSLGSWVGTQRAYYRKGILAANREELLEGLPGWVWQAKSGPRRS